MAYERNDDRYGNRDRGHGREGDRSRSYGFGQRDYRGNRFDDRGDGNRDDRGFFDRAGDEVRSWFGDDEAERRRREDARYDERNRSYGSGAYSDYQGSGGGYGAGDDRGYGRGRYDDRDRYGAGDRDYARGSSSYSQSDYTGSSYDRSRIAGAGYDAGRNAGDRWGGGTHDHNYGSWRDRQLQSFDRDYDEYRRENQSRFESEFGTWRQGRQTQRDSLQRVQEHQEVVGSDGAHVGTVDHVRGDHIQLTRGDQDAGGKHHRIPSSWVQSVDDRVTLNKTADQARQHWRDEGEDRNRGGLFGQRDNNPHAPSTTRCAGGPPPHIVGRITSAA